MKYSLAILFFTAIPLFPRTTVTVFIHGTSGAGLELLANPSLLVRKQDPEFIHSNKLQRAFRALRFNQEVQLMGKIGLMQLDAGRISGYLSESQPDACAWYHIVAAYDAVSASLFQAANVQREYYLFGWSGMLSLGARKKAGKQLFAVLMNLVEEYRARSEEIDIIIEAHSHGGNVAFHAANYAEAEGLPFAVAELRTYGTPISTESVSGIMSPFYREIYAMSAPNDFIQCGDRFSTPDRKSSSMMSDVVKYEHIDLSLKRCDVRIVPHAQNSSRTRTINHMNLWWIDRGDFLALPLHPLPFVVLGSAATFVLQSASASTHAGSYTLSVCDSAEGCYLVESANGAGYTVLHSVLTEYTNQLATRWKPDWCISDTMPLNLAWVFARDLPRALIR